MASDTTGPPPIAPERDPATTSNEYEPPPPVLDRLRFDPPRPPVEQAVPSTAWRG